MSRTEQFEPVFVDFIPPLADLEQGRLYISMKYTTVVHLCASGCGAKVNLPLNPSKWSLKFDGESISMSPSIGNWDLPCQSHYWIRNNRVVWAGKWDKDRIEAGRRNDQRDVDDHFSRPAPQRPVKRSFWSRFFDRD